LGRSIDRVAALSRDGGVLEKLLCLTDPIEAYQLERSYLQPTVGLDEGIVTSIRKLTNDRLSRFDSLSHWFCLPR
jgi:hypothetical protein